MNELEEFLAITFITHGNVGIGYEINRIKKICLLYKGNYEYGGF